MCTTCGCNQPEEAVTIHTHAEGHAHEHHEHGHEHHHHHGHEHGHHHHHHGEKTVIELEQDILQKNNLLAERNRGYFDAKNILALNLVSSPGSGKTALLERTIRDIGAEMPVFVIEGDQQTMNDADRIAATGAPVVQINTGKGCHLDSDMINKALKKLNPAEGAVVMIENVGNLVCPAMFDLGETARVVIMSVTEGDDKPIKYPDMFHSAHLCIINKTDLLPYVPFDVEKAKAYARQVNHHLSFIEVSAYTGEGMEAWYKWLRHALHHARRGEAVHHHH
ncbi:MAG TPA: hydrogenase nickel incorporation protein HypB [Saprospiraceae bacterium]|nr:hydrogenase nickel incorporation protein HypB [Saprospiraceae bacterium]